MELSKIQKLRISVRIINALKENKHPLFYINEYGSDLNKLIATKSGIPLSYNREAGMIEINEYILLTQEDWEMELVRKEMGDRRRFNHSVKRFQEFEQVGEELIAQTKEFEDTNIPKSGPCKTLVGEIFRAIQYIQYRAHNDGDQWFIIDSPTFLSGMFLQSMIDELNWSSDSYNEETGQHKFQFTNKFVKENSWEGRISNTIEHSLAKDADFIKYQLMDLLTNGKIKDVPNIYDSRNFIKLNKVEIY